MIRYTYIVQKGSPINKSFLIYSLRSSLKQSSNAYVTIFQNAQENGMNVYICLLFKKKKV